MKEFSAQEILSQLTKYCIDTGFKGYDPFDGLNSRFFDFFPIFRKSDFFKLAWIQFFKRSPINFRKIAGIKKDYNPKGLGLFLSAYCNLYKKNQDQEILERIRFFISQIKKQQSTGYSGACWGYNFDWQSKAFFQPKGTPSVVVTSFVGCSLLDAYEITQDPELISIARSACNFVMKDLRRSYDDEGDFSFSYSPLDQTQVYNASLLGVRLLCRTYAFTKEPSLLEESRKAVAFVCRRQQENGSWTYSPLPFHSWIDNFHTGYILECIYTYQTISKDDSFKKQLDKGLEFYLTTFFETSGFPGYYSHSKYPADMHNTAQLIVTLSKMGLLNREKELIERVLQWSFKHMFDKKRGYFYYYKEKYFTIKIPYIRWTEAWMFLGLSHFLLNNAKENYISESINTFTHSTLTDIKRL